jgi:hypothetical protein
MNREAVWQIAATTNHAGPTNRILFRILIRVIRVIRDPKTLFSAPPCLRGEQALAWAVLPAASARRAVHGFAPGRPIRGGGQAPFHSGKADAGIVVVGGAAASRAICRVGGTLRTIHFLSLRCAIQGLIRDRAGSRCRRLGDGRSRLYRTRICSRRRRYRRRGAILSQRASAWQQGKREHRHYETGSDSLSHDRPPDRRHLGEVSGHNRRARSHTPLVEGLLLVRRTASAWLALLDPAFNSILAECAAPGCYFSFIPRTIAKSVGAWGRRFRRPQNVAENWGLASLDPSHPNKELEFAIVLGHPSLFSAFSRCRGWRDTVGLAPADAAARTA